MSGAMKEQRRTSLRRVKPYPAYKDSGVEWLAVFLGPAIAAARGDSRPGASWQPGGPWVPIEEPRA